MQRARKDALRALKRARAGASVTRDAHRDTVAALERERAAARRRDSGARLQVVLVEFCDSVHMMFYSNYCLILRAQLAILATARSLSASVWSVEPRRHSCSERSDFSHAHMSIRSVVSVLPTSRSKQCM